jgi:hypothetical protein
MAQFRCSKCGKSFSSSANLGRHAALSHRRKPSGAKQQTKAHHRQPATPAFPKFGSGLGQFMTGLRDYVQDLVSQRIDLEKQIERVNRAMSSFLPRTTVRIVRQSAAAPRRASTTVRVASGGQGGSLKDFAVKVLRKSGQPMRLRDIERGVRQAGFKTKNKTLDTSLGIALSELKKKGMVRKVARGVYQAQ